MMIRFGERESMLLAPFGVRIPGALHNRISVIAEVQGFFAP
jgi:hypothetical protein